ncbi:antirepressor [Betaproteobacteria bacterium]|nr:antirepressor [Betaproteobacteria bacterium]
MKVARDFLNWIKTRLAEYGFIEGEDYSPNLANNTGKRGKPRTDYHLTLDTAKELAMVERNEQGRIIRRYFIECERKALEKPGISLNHRRFLVWYDDNKECIKEVPEDAAIMTTKGFIEGIVQPNGIHLSTQELETLAAATLQRLAHRCVYYEERARSDRATGKK